MLWRRGCQNPKYRQAGIPGNPFYKCIYNCCNKCSCEVRNYYRYVPDLNWMHAYENYILPQRSAENPVEFTAVPPHYVKAFTEYMRAAGYYCTNNNKTDYQFTKDPVPASIWDECSRTAHYKNRPDKSQPFFAVFNWIGTHESQNWDIIKIKTDPKTVKVPPYYPDNEVIRRNIAKCMIILPGLIQLLVS